MDFISLTLIELDHKNQKICDRKVGIMVTKVTRNDSKSTGFDLHRSDPRFDVQPGLRSRCPGRRKNLTVDTLRTRRETLPTDLVFFLYPFVQLKMSHPNLNRVTVKPNTRYPVSFSALTRVVVTPFLHVRQISSVPPLTTYV